MIKLVSEQLLKDGGYHLTQLLKDANARLKKDGRHGKTCQLKRSGNSVTLQFHFTKQENKGCGCQFTTKGIERAEQIARLVTSQLVADNFSWNWYDRLIGKKEQPETTSPKTFEALLIEYKKHWFSENRSLKHPNKQWYDSYNYLEIAKDNIPFDEKIIKKIIEGTLPNSSVRYKTLNALLNFCQFFDIVDFNPLINSYKKKNKPSKKRRHIPDDCEIALTFEQGFEIKKGANPKFYYRYKQWQFLYSLLAVYGLRIHEAWSLANWNTSVKIKQGDWVAIDDINDDSEIEVQILGKDFIVPSILDPDNTKKILCIKHNTKTGYRMAFPLSPNGKDWVKEFNLIQPLNLPDISDPLVFNDKINSFNCTNKTCQWFYNHYPFTAHALRHAYNHRGHSLGISPTILSQSLGHSLQLNSSTYLKTMPDSRKLENFKNAIDEQIKNQNELEQLRIENIHLKAENEMLKAKLQLIYSERSGNL